MKKMKNGFTLMEILIVVALIVFLASIALPRYSSYFRRARQAEVAFNLASLHTAQQSYWLIHGKYSRELSGPTGLGWEPEGYNGGGEKVRFYYTYGFNFPGAQEGIHFFTGKLKTDKSLLGMTKVDQKEFIAGAAARHSHDTKPDIWRIDQTRNLEHIAHQDR